MKVVILAGGYGTRISEESHLKPKPMIEIGEKPILWHIMKHFTFYGFNEFIICAGYKQNIIKEYFANYYLRNCDITFDLSKNNEMEIHKSSSEPWKVTVIDTGLNTMTGGRIKRIEKYIGNESFIMTYGDGVSDVDIYKLLFTHETNKKIATVTAVMPGGRFGALDINERGLVESFKEKNIEDGGWINGGYVVLEPEIFKYIKGDDTIFEKEPLTHLVEKNQVQAYKHLGFWQCMDTLRDKVFLEELWNNNKAPWRVWK